jgi:phage tail-like protein
MSTGTTATATSASSRWDRDAPPSASARAYLRNGLPAVYRDTWEIADRPSSESTGDDLESPFAMRFLKALEELLDPIITVLDCLPAYLDPKLAPDNALQMMGLWLGLPLNEQLGRHSQEEHLSRKSLQRLVENAIEISRWRCTAKGLQLLLELMFGDPDRPEDPLFIITDGGYCAADSVPPADAAGRPEPGTFVVRWTRHLDDEHEAAMRRLVEREKPVNTTCLYQPPEPARPPSQKEAKV